MTKHSLKDRGFRRVSLPQSPDGIFVMQSFVLGRSRGGRQVGLVARQMASGSFRTESHEDGSQTFGSDYGDWILLVVDQAGLLTDRIYLNQNYSSFALLHFSWNGSSGRSSGFASEEAAVYKIGQNAKRLKGLFLAE